MPQEATGSSWRSEISTAENMLTAWLPSALVPQTSTASQQGRAPDVHADCARSQRVRHRHFPLQLPALPDVRQRCIHAHRRDRRHRRLIRPHDVRRRLRPPPHLRRTAWHRSATLWRRLAVTGQHDAMQRDMKHEKLYQRCMQAEHLCTTCTLLPLTPSKKCKGGVPLSSMRTKAALSGRGRRTGAAVPFQTRLCRAPPDTGAHPGIDDHENRCVPSGSGL